MDPDAELVKLEELSLEVSMSRETIIGILDQKYGDRRSMLLPVFQNMSINYCFESVEQALYQLVHVEEPIPISLVVMCLEIWSMIASYETTDEEEKHFICSWMNGEVADTIFIETTTRFIRRFGIMGA